MPGIHHPPNPPDPEMLTPHPRETCEQDRCGLPPWRAEDQALYRQGYAAGYLAAHRTKPCRKVHAHYHLRLPADTMLVWTTAQLSLGPRGIIIDHRWLEDEREWEVCYRWSGSGRPPA
jgi:hypothetical protein